MDKEYDIDLNLVLLSEKYTKEKKYWMEKLEGTINNHYICFDLEEEKKYHRESYEFFFEEDTFNKLKIMSNESNMSIYLIMLTCLKTLLYKYSKNNDVVVGSPLYKTNYSEKLLNNMVALKDSIYGEMTFKECIMQVRGTVLEAYENQNYPLLKIIEDINKTNKNNHMSMCDVVCLLNNIHDEKFINEYISNIIFSFSKTENSMKCNIYYNKSVFKRETIVQISKQFEVLLKEVMKNSMIKVDEINIISQEEKNKLLYDFNNTILEYSKEKTVHHLFEEQVNKTPDNIALIFKNEKLSYLELNQKSNKVARLLRANGVKENDIVGLMIDRSLEMIIGILGILKAGAAYLPIECNYPQNRINYICEDSGLKYLLSKKNISNNRKIKENVIVINIENEMSMYESDNLDLETSLKNLAYIIYTSGSTGNPKGVMIEHGNLLAYLIAFNHEYDLKSKDTVIQQASYCFDAFVEEIYPILLKGGKIIISSEEEIKDNKLFYKSIKDNNVTFLSCSPLMLNELNRMKKIESLKIIISGGDVLKEKYIKDLKKSGQVYNTYGPTEGTVCATYHKYTDYSKQNILIGRPIANYKIYVIDENNKLVPIGIPGEMCIAGDGVARGYLNNPELTKKHFVKNHLVQGERMYKTGDLARWLPSGEIEFIGRKDYQVKIRGYRIELGEIENQLLMHDKIKEAVVIDREDENEDKFLCAYVVPESDVTISELREYLIEYLPEYMVPAYFVVLNKLPLNINGKIDKSLLPEPNNNIKTGTDYIEPRDDIEKILIDIWKEVLCTSQKISIKDNFFALGGHSLKATTVAIRIHQKLNIEVSLMEIFKRTTIEELAVYIRGIDKNNCILIEKVEEKEYYELSSAQKRMYVVNTLEPDNVNYNMPIILNLKGIIDIEKIENLFIKLINRHESLRTSFCILENEPVQIVEKNVKFNIEYNEIKVEDIKDEIERFIRPFDISKAPLFKVRICKIYDYEHLMMIDMNHIISDGVSQEIIMEEFAKLYNGEDLELLKLQYKDYAQWQGKMILSREMDKQEQYWINKFSKGIPTLNLPIDYERDEVNDLTMDTINRRLDSDVSNKLMSIAIENDATLYMVFLAAYNTLLYRYTGQNRIIVGSPISGRNHPDLEKIVGMFVNMIAMEVRHVVN